MRHHHHHHLFFIALAALPILLSMLGGCHGPLLFSQPEAALVAADQYEIVQGLDVPQVEGVAGCGAQALATAMAHAAPDLDATTLAAELPWHDQGATPVDLLLAARERGGEARIARGDLDDLVEAMERDQAVLVMIDTALEVRTLTGGIPTPRVMHWSVVSGVAHDRSAVLIAAPSARHHRVAKDDFMERWATSSYCMIVVSWPIAARGSGG